MTRFGRIYTDDPGRKARSQRAPTVKSARDFLEGKESEVTNREAREEREGSFEEERSHERG